VADNGKEVPGTGSARKVLQVLLTFSEQHPRATVAELAAQMNITPATAYRYVALLRSLGLVEEGPRSTYQLTAKVMPLARAAQVVNDEARVARPVMEGLAHRLGETVMLFSASGELAVCVERVESSSPMRFTFEPGHSLQLGFGASGKMMLAALAEAERARVVETLPAERRQRLAAELEEITGRGYAESFGEVDRGVWACSVPVRTSGRSPLVLSLAGPEGRIPKEERPDIIDAMKAGAGALRDGLEQFQLA
jgi:DNA-binding IclR family transcriptional regulator